MRPSVQIKEVCRVGKDKDNTLRGIALRPSCLGYAASASSHARLQRPLTVYSQQ